MKERQKDTIFRLFNGTLNFACMTKDSACIVTEYKSLHFVILQNKFYHFFLDAIHLP